MGKWKLAWKAPKLAMVAKPIELSFEKMPTPPSNVRLEVWESEMRKHEVDDYDNKIPRTVKRENDDLIARFEGTLEPRSPKGGLFKVSSGGAVRSEHQANDHIVLKFEGATKTYKCGVPFNPGKEPTDDDSDGGFYEIYVMLFDADAGEEAAPIVTTDVHLVRRRTDLLLKVEPLNQANAQLGGGMGNMIFKYFHDGNSRTANRNWGNVIIGTYNGNPIAKTIGKSGCNYVVLCMALRYFRRSLPPPEGEPEPPPSEKKWITIFDEVVDKGLKEAFKPMTRVQKDDWSIFSLTGNQIKAKAKSIKKKGKHENVVFTPNWKTVPAGPERTKLQGVRKETDAIKDWWWLPKLVWWVRQEQAAGKEKPPDADDTVQKDDAITWTITKADGTEETIPATHDNGAPATGVRFRGSYKWTLVDADGRVMPPYGSTLETKLKIKATQIGSGSKKFKQWDKTLVAHLKKGLPAIAHVKSGRYLSKDKGGGHYILVVGYRTGADGLKRFIVNDPAGAKILQYETFRERDVKPTMSAARRYATSLKVSAVLSRDGVEIGKGNAEFSDEAELDGALEGKFPEREIDLGGGIVATFVMEGGTAPAKAQTMSEFRYSVEVTEGETTLSALHEATKCKIDNQLVKNKKWAASGKASHSKDTLELDLKFSAIIENKPGLRLPKGREGRYDTLVERRRHDSLFAIYLLEPRFPVEDGAPQFLVFDGKAVE